MNNKLTITILSGVTVISLALAIFFYSNQKTHELNLKYTNDQSFAEVTTSMSKIDSAINKLNYSTTPTYTISMLTEIFAESQTVQRSLSTLPIDESEIGDTAEFVSKIGDYSLSLIKKVAGGNSLTDEEYSNISMFSKNATMLANEFSDLQQLYNEGELADYKISFSSFKNRESLPANTEITGSNSSDLNETTDVQVEMQDFATLVYDGPFSSHINQMTPVFLEEKEEISEEEARRRAEQIFQTENIEYTGKVDGQIPCYKFNVKIADSEISLDMTVNGGYILNLLDYREMTDIKLSAEECVDRANEILENGGYSNFKETYYIERNGILTINYAFTQNDVILYPDLIKVSIYMDDGSLKGVEARGYIMSHQTRSLADNNFSFDEAREVVSKNLTIISEEMAIIPTSSKGEVLSYEFKCQNENNENFIVYVNAKTCEIENILILIEDETGTLAI